MTKQEYFNFREDLAIHNKLTNYLQVINEIYFDYPLFRGLTIQEYRDYLFDKINEFDNRIKEHLNVEE